MVCEWGVTSIAMGILGLFGIGMIVDGYFRLKERIRHFRHTCPDGQLHEWRDVGSTVNFTTVYRCQRCLTKRIGGVYDG